MPTRIAAYIVISCMLLGVSASFAETRAEARPLQKRETNVRDAAALPIDDGPYASYQNGKPGLNVSWVCKGKAIRKTVAKADGAVLNPECGFPIPINIRDESPAFPVTAKFTAKKLVALSDIHGQFDTMVRLLRANGVIDREMKWSFGEGHVVVVGDMFDRGPNVTDVLWLLYQPMRPFAHRGGTHTMSGVFSHYDGRVISVDTNIQKGLSGELFMWQEGKLTRGSIQGEQMPLTECVKATESGAH